MKKIGKIQDKTMVRLTKQELLDSVAFMEKIIQRLREFPDADHYQITCTDSELKILNATSVTFVIKEKT